MPLPEGFYWENFDARIDEVANEVCDFLMDHYVESNTGDFRLIYTVEKFRWAILSPGYNPEFHFVVRSDKNKKIMGCILSVPRKYVICG